MTEKKRFLLRIDPSVHRALERWAADDLRSVNAQIEFLLTESLRRAGRLRPARGRDDAEPDAAPRGGGRDEGGTGDA